MRRNVSTLSATDKANYVSAVKALKAKAIAPPTGYSATNVYDWYVETHATGAALYHQTSWFLPWHRQFLMDFEEEISEILGGINFSMPYWSWADDFDQKLGWQGSVWSQDFMGYPAPGSTTPQGALKDWTVWPGNTNPLVRRGNPQLSRIPNSAEVWKALSVFNYDQEPWSTFSDPLNSFRRYLEQLHGLIHGWVGGTMGMMATSPNDPVFYLHHCNVDRLWAQWQEIGVSKKYLPAGNSGISKDADALMWPWDGVAADRKGRQRTINAQDVWEFEKLPYTYDRSFFNQGEFYIQSSKYPGRYIGASDANDGSLVLWDKASAKARLNAKWRLERQTGDVGPYGRFSITDFRFGGLISQELNNPDGFCHHYPAHTGGGQLPNGQLWAFASFGIDANGVSLATLYSDPATAFMSASDDQNRVLCSTYGAASAWHLEL